MSSQTFSQPTKAPTRKVSFAGFGAILGTILAAAMHASGNHLLVTMVDYPGFESAMGGGLAFLFAYYARERLQ